MLGLARASRKQILRTYGGYCFTEVDKTTYNGLSRGGIKMGIPLYAGAINKGNHFGSVRLTPYAVTTQRGTLFFGFSLEKSVHVCL